MLNLQGTADLLLTWSQLLQHHFPSEYWPAPTLAAGVAVSAGLILALWGARLLRGLYVLGFMVGGGALGIKFARHFGVDDLFGLVLGAGLAGLAGYLFYRWWIGLTAGVCALVLLAAIGGPRALPDLPVASQAFLDEWLGVGSEAYALGDPSDGGALAMLGALRTYLGDRYEAVATKLAVVLGLTWLLGLAMGVLLPRFTAIVGTSLVGILAAAIGAKVLLSAHWPNAWSSVADKEIWALGVLGTCLLASLAYQGRPRRPAVPPYTIPAE